MSTKQGACFGSPKTTNSEEKIENARIIVLSNRRFKIAEAAFKGTCSSHPI